MDYYRVLPSIVPADQASAIRIEPLFDHANFPEASDEFELEICHLPIDGEYQDNQHQEYDWSLKSVPRLKFTRQGKALCVRGFFAGEQEHNLLMLIWKKNASDGKKTIVKRLSFRVYSLHEDLLKLRPFQGNFHIHSTRSDGAECPAYVAARYRQIGFDFAAISDHGNYAPSLEAIAAFQNLNLDFKLFPGEEVHAPGNGVHIINFAGSFSVNKQAYDNETDYRADVARRIAAIPEAERRNGVNYFAVCASEWVFDQIRSGGGLAVFCHPYWYTGQNVIPENLTSEIFRRKKFDAFELVGGFYRHQYESNNYQIVRYYEEAARGNRFPVVGLSDSHATDHFRRSNSSDASVTGMEYRDSHDADLFPWYYTIVLAESDSRDALVSAIRNFHSVAVSDLGNNAPQVFGDFRLVKYASFLMREYFPMHHVLARTEGDAMLAHLLDNPAAARMLALMKNQIPTYRDAFFTPLATDNGN